MVAAVDRPGRRYLETMWAIYDLQRCGVRLRSLAGKEGKWTKFLDAAPDSPEAFMGSILASMAAYVARRNARASDAGPGRGWTTLGRRGRSRAGRDVSP